MLGTCLENVKTQVPLVHNITNYVTVNDVANVLLACGGSPIMSDDIEEVEEITSICGGLNINIGTLNQRTIPAMFAAGKKAELDSRKAQFRKEKLMKVQEEAKRAMDEVVSECNNYDLEMDKEIQMKVMELRDLAKERTDNAIKAVIQALA